MHWVKVGMWCRRGLIWRWESLFAVKVGIVSWNTDPYTSFDDGWCWAFPTPLRRYLKSCSSARQYHLLLLLILSWFCNRNVCLVNVHKILMLLIWRSATVLFLVEALRRRDLRQSWLMLHLEWSACTAENWWIGTIIVWIWGLASQLLLLLEQLIVLVFLNKSVTRSSGSKHLS